MADTKDGTVKTAAVDFKPSATWNAKAQFAFEEEILELVQNGFEDMTTSDLQGCIGALVIKIQTQAVKAYLADQK